MKAETKSPSDSADNVGPKAGWNINNTNSFSLFNAVDITSSQTGTMPDLQPTDMNKAIDDILNDPSFDPAWFNLDPTDYYSSVGNSCGFLSDIPNIIDEVDRDHILESIERTTDPIEEYVRSFPNFASCCAMRRSTLLNSNLIMRTGISHGHHSYIQALSS